MEILLIIMLAPLALALGLGLIRILLEPAVWFILLGVFVLFAFAGMVG